MPPWLLLIMPLLLSSASSLSCFVTCCHDLTSLSYFKVEEAIRNEKEKHSVECNELKKQLGQVRPDKCLLLRCYITHNVIFIMALCSLLSSFVSGFIGQIKTEWEERSKRR